MLVLGAGELGRVVDENPFLKQRGVDPTKLHVTFLAAAPAAAGLKKMEGVSSGRDAFHCLGKNLSRFPDGYGNTKLSNNAFERALSACRDDPQLEDGHHAGRDGHRRARPGS